MKRYVGIRIVATHYVEVEGESVKDIVNKLQAELDADDGAPRVVIDLMPAIDRDGDAFSGNSVTTWEERQIISVTERES